FAHHFITSVPPALRTPSPSGAKSMAEEAQKKLEPVPILVDDPIWTLDDVVGSTRARQIESAGALRFHACGDTGDGSWPVDKATDTFSSGGISKGPKAAQIAVASAMDGDINPSLPGQSPAFFFHLGDVIYFDNTPAGFHEQFYVPYQKYSGKIIAIPGNHDA